MWPLLQQVCEGMGPLNLTQLAEDDHQWTLGLVHYLKAKCGTWGPKVQVQGKSVVKVNCESGFKGRGVDGTVHHSLIVFQEMSDKGLHELPWHFPFFTESQPSWSSSRRGKGCYINVKTLYTSCVSAHPHFSSPLPPSLKSVHFLKKNFSCKTSPQVCGSPRVNILQAALKMPYKVHNECQYSFTG